VGQRGSLRLSFGRRGGATVLKERYASAPFGAVRANYLDGSDMPEVQITNPSGGILGGDSLEMEVYMAAGSCATVVTQAASKAYRGVRAEQRAAFHLAGGVVLEYLPHHLIPYAGSAYRQETTFHLATDATLIAWDAYSAGRVVRTERFAFDRLHARLEIQRDHVPEAIDGFDLAGGTEHFGGYSYMASAYVMSPHDLGALAESVHESLTTTQNALASASAPSPNLCAVRVLTHDANTLYRRLNDTRALAREHLDLPTPAREII